DISVTVDVVLVPERNRPRRSAHRIRGRNHSYFRGSAEWVLTRYAWRSAGSSATNGRLPGSRSCSRSCRASCLRLLRGFTLEEQNVAGIDPMRIGNPGVGFPKLRPQIAVLVKLRRQSPQRVAGFDRVRLRVRRIGRWIRRAVGSPMIADAMELTRRMR